MVGRRGSFVVGVLVGAFLVAGVAHAAGERCSAAKLRAAGRKAASKISCYRKAVLASMAPDADCLARAEAKFVRAFAAADARGGCLTTGDAADVEAIVDQFIADLLAHFPNTTTTSTSTTSSSSTPSTISCGGGGVCSSGPCGSNGEFCQTVPSCVCGGPIFCICSATTFTTCTMPICSTTSTIP
jgi:hypothetical protein